MDLEWGSGCKFGFLIHSCHREVSGQAALDVAEKMVDGKMELAIEKAIVT
jgi:hypothetical protein